MAELLVRIVDKTSTDPYLNAQLTKRGDVIVVVEDGHRWGRDELANTEWKIIKVPGVKASDVSGFLAPEPNGDNANPSRVLQRRAFRFNLAAKPKNLADLLAAQVRKPRLQDPNVIGG